MKNETWVCDSCGDEIQNVNQGWIEWLVPISEDRVAGHGLRLVHRYSGGDRFRCQYNDEREFKNGYHIYDSSLCDFIGADGLMKLLGKISDDDLPREEILEMIKRLHVPGYEKARRHFERAISEGVFEPNSKRGFYSQSNILATLEWAEQNQ